jgi:hypothetical protein
MRDKTCVWKFNGETPAEWLSIRKIGEEDWLNSIGCLELVLPGHDKNMITTSINSHNVSGESTRMLTNGPSMKQFYEKGPIESSMETPNVLPLPVMQKDYEDYMPLSRIFWMERLAIRSHQ